MLSEKLNSLDALGLEVVASPLKLELAPGQTGTDERHRLLGVTANYCAAFALTNISCHISDLGRKKAVICV